MTAMKGKIRMYLPFVVAMLGVAMFAFISTAADLTTPPTATNVNTQGATSGTNGLLTTQEIAKLQTVWTDPITGNQLIFNASFSRRELNSDEEKAVHMRYVRWGKVPYSVTATLVQQEKGKYGPKLVTTGSARFYVTDSEGKVVTQPQIQDLLSLCPS
jgi:hypothetical protein